MKHSYKPALNKRIGDNEQGGGNIPYVNPPGGGHVVGAHCITLFLSQSSTLARFGLGNEVKEGSSAFPSSSRSLLSNDSVVSSGKPLQS